mmetsp:Transcript_10840/g.16709  ORF Transcript_10840/g.16709 Transcript_10840/m.16709 type:complete len:214 (+) Transcript_10840:118-759(+)
MEESAESARSCEGDICKIRPEETTSCTEKDDSHEEIVTDEVKSSKGNDVTNRDNAIRNETNQQPVTPSSSSTKSNRRKKEKNTLSPSIIKTLHEQKDLDTLVSENDAVVIEFMTTWCGACKSIEEYYTELSTFHQECIRSAKVVCDKNKQTKKLAAEYNVKSYPVFIVFKDGIVTNRWDGANKGKLESTFERLAGGGASGKGKKNKGGRSKRR